MQEYSIVEDTFWVIEFLTRNDNIKNVLFDFELII